MHDADSGADAEFGAEFEFEFESEGVVNNNNNNNNNINSLGMPSSAAATSTQDGTTSALGGPMGEGRSIDGYPGGLQAPGNDNVSESPSGARVISVFWVLFYLRKCST